MLQKYEEWRDGLPDMAWLSEVFPDNEQWQKFSTGVVSITEKLKDSIEIGLLHHPPSIASILMSNAFSDPRLKQLGEEKMSEWRLWFDNRLDNAIEAAEVEAQLEGANSPSMNSSSTLVLLDRFKNDCDFFIFNSLLSPFTATGHTLVQFNNFLEGKIINHSWIVKSQPTIDDRLNLMSLISIFRYQK